MSKTEELLSLMQEASDKAEAQISNLKSVQVKLHQAYQEVSKLEKARQAIIESIIKAEDDPKKLRIMKDFNTEYKRLKDKLESSTESLSEEIEEALSDLLDAAKGLDNRTW